MMLNHSAAIYTVTVKSAATLSNIDKMFRTIASGGCPCYFFIVLVLANSLTSSLVASEVNLSEKGLDKQTNNNEELDRSYLASLVERFDALSHAVKKQEKEAEEMVASIPAEKIKEALRYGQEYVDEWNQLEERIAKADENRFLQQGTSDKNGGTLLSSTAAKYSARFSFKRHNPAAMAQSKEAAVDYAARQYLSDKLGIPIGKIGAIRLAASSNSTDRQAELPFLASCDVNSRFRTMDGSCNSQYQPRFGQAGTIFQRLMTFNNYADNVARFRISASGQPLPSPRLVSTTVIVNDTVPDPSVTLLTMQWGQFLDHDLTLTPTFTKSDGSAYQCCSQDQTGFDISPPHSECTPIAIPRGDKKFDPSATGQVTCMNFIRSTYGKDLNGNTPSMRFHVNSLTHWIDGSNVYGSDTTTAQRLRDPIGNGRMKVSFNGDRQMLPVQPNCCKAPIPTGGTCTAICFDAGDERVNEQPLLSLMHTIWVREHNRIVDNLHLVAPFQTPEFYYQHARKIVIAEMQHIIYNEYLPVMIGTERAAQVISQEFYYSPYYNPAIYTEFSTAAFRMGHSQLRSFVRLFEMSGRNSNNSYSLSDSFDEPFRMIQQNFMDDALRGLLQVPAMAVDNCMADDITSQLFRPKTKTLGLDLISLNIQRGRDHGLPPYAWMSYYLNSNYLLQTFPNQFEHLLPKMSLEVVNAMRTVYGNVNDIDLFIGGVVETPLPNAVLGPTFAGLFALQFVNLRRADRFFYTSNIGQPYALTQNQLAEIEKVSLAKIICDNSDGSITRIQPKAFRIPDDLLNKPVPCSSMTGIDFNKFLPL